MSLIMPNDWLEWHSTRNAQDNAVRLLLACSAVLPSDKNLALLVEEQVVSDLVSFAVHGRRTMERNGQKSATVGDDPTWPPSSASKLDGNNLWHVFGVIIHATKIQIVWENADMQPNPFKGREPKFAGSVEVSSDSENMKLSIGSLVASFFGNVLNKTSEKKQKETV
ncbi:hypothetical protein TRL7639_03760 [Falsiruegeria litorea R37]|uniref:Uncharacterized protein n=1 Tax=Falsiruegeria litorea R37 TaxID=1200284 RepID=A0A1Y5TKM7_9RHOB|nr:hypothetical protein [Falsiruegeria litorea]SLN66228.1 hypothetical protein TRL7639_03760 [Falsiruegeria litorea R37]